MKFNEYLAENYTVEELAETVDLMGETLAEHGIFDPTLFELEMDYYINVVDPEVKDLRKTLPEDKFIKTIFERMNSSEVNPVYALSYEAAIEVLKRYFKDN